MIFSPIDQADLQFSKIGYGVRRSIAVRRTKLPGVAQHQSAAVEIDFPDEIEISSYSGELAGAAAEVGGVGDDCVHAGSHLGRGSSRLVKGERVSRIGDPV